MITVAGDIEIYQNYFSCVIRTIESNTRFDFLIYDDIDDRPKLIHFLNQDIMFVGFNSMSFDIPILQALTLGYSLGELCQLRDNIINYKGMGNPDEVIQIQQQAKSIKGLDLKRVLNIDTSLKQCAIMLQWPKLQELPLDPNAVVSPDMARVLLEYNDNDSSITRALCIQSTDDNILRKLISKQYETDVTNASESQIANILMANLYSETTGLNLKSFRNLRTFHKKIKVGDCIASNIEFISPQMKKFHSEIKSIVLKYDDNDPSKLLKSFKANVTLNGVRYNLGRGGLHSVDGPGAFVSNDDVTYRDADVISFYPHILINNEIYPQHLDPVFVQIISKILKDRLREREAGNILNAATLKILILSFTGKLNSPDSWLYDPFAFYSMTISGQLYLLSLIDKFNSEGIKTISANTDGVLSEIETSQLSTYQSICDDWESHTGFELDHTKYAKYIRRDVNSYLALTSKGKIKTKGAFDDITKNPNFSRIVKRKYNMPIVQKALRAFFIDDILPQDFIHDATSIFDFLIAHKPAKKYQVYYDGKEVQHVNRFYATKQGGRLYKQEPGTSKQISILTEKVSLLNDVDKNGVENYPNLHYAFYIKEVQKIINLIKPRMKKHTLF